MESTGRKYWVKTRHSVAGPFTGRQIRRLAAEGKLHAHHRFSTDQQRWTPVSQIRKLNLAESNTASTDARDAARADAQTGVSSPARSPGKTNVSAEDERDVTVYCGKCGGKISAHLGRGMRTLECPDCKETLPVRSGREDQAYLALFCPHCRTGLLAELDSAGASVQCSKCQHTITLAVLDDDSEQADASSRKQVILVSLGAVVVLAIALWVVLAPKGLETGTPVFSGRGRQFVDSGQDDSNSPTGTEPASEPSTQDRQFVHSELITFLLPGKASQTIFILSDRKDTFDASTSETLRAPRGSYFYVVRAKIDYAAWPKRAGPFDKKSQGVTIGSEDVVLETDDGRLIHPSYASYGMPSSLGSHEIGFVRGPLMGVAFALEHATSRGKPIDVMEFTIAFPGPREDLVETSGGGLLDPDPTEVPFRFAFVVPVGCDVAKVKISDAAVLGQGQISFR